MSFFRSKGPSKLKSSLAMSLADVDALSDDAAAPAAPTEVAAAPTAPASTVNTKKKDARETCSKTEGKGEDWQETRSKEIERWERSCGKDRRETHQAEVWPQATSGCRQAIAGQKTGCGYPKEKVECLHFPLQEGWGMELQAERKRSDQSILSC